MIRRAFVKKLKFTKLSRGQFNELCGVRTTKIQRNRNIRTRVRGFLLSGMIRRAKTTINRYVLEHIEVE